MNDEKKSGPNPWIAIIISIAAFVVSSTTLYFIHFCISESLYILLLGFDIRKMEETDHEGNPRSLVNGLIANLAVTNRGNQNIIISKIYTSYRHIAYDSVSVQILVEAKKLNDDTLVTPLLIVPRNVEQLSVHFPLDQKTLRNATNQLTEDLHIHFNLLFTTVGGYGNLQMNTLAFAELWLKDGQFFNATMDTATP